MLRRELKFYWIALSADFAFMLFVFTVTRLMAENQASLMALGILGAVSSLGFGLGAPIGGWASDVWGGRRVVAVGASVQAMVLLACIQWHSDHQWFYLYAPIGGASVGFDASPGHRLVDPGRAGAAWPQAAGPAALPVLPLLEPGNDRGAGRGRLALSVRSHPAPAGGAGADAGGAGSDRLPDCCSHPRRLATLRDGGGGGSQVPPVPSSTWAGWPTWPAPWG